jgi:hypothetical protein
MRWARFEHAETFRVCGASRRSEAATRLLKSLSDFVSHGSERHAKQSLTNLRSTEMRWPRFELREDGLSLRPSVRLLSFKFGATLRLTDDSRHYASLVGVVRRKSALAEI